MADYKGIVEKYYEKFLTAKGNQYIAGMYAIQRVIQLIDTYDIKRVLEVGGGIGTFSYVVTKYAEERKKHIKYDLTEADEFCVSQIKKNFSEDINKITIYNAIEDVNHNEKYDLIIIDGQDESMAKVKNMATSRAIIFIEGARESTLHKMDSLFPDSIRVESISLYKPKKGPHDPNLWSTGGGLIFTNPTFSQKIDAYTEKVYTSLKFRVLRKFKS